MDKLAVLRRTGFQPVSGTQFQPVRSYTLEASPTKALLREQKKFDRREEVVPERYEQVDCCSCGRKKSNEPDCFGGFTVARSSPQARQSAGSLSSKARRRPQPQDVGLASLLAATALPRQAGSLSYDDSGILCVAALVISTIHIIIESAPVREIDKHELC